MKRVALVLLGLLIAVSTANAKTYTKIVLNNGSVIEGVLIEENNQIVRLEFANRDIRVFYKSDIASLSTFEVITPEEQLVAELTAAAKAKETTKAEKQAQIAAKKEAEAKAKAEKRAEIAAQKEAAAIKRKEDAIKYRGYRQFVDLSYSYCGVTDFLGVSYIGGYRFNPYIFLGLGTGVNFALFTPNANKLSQTFCKPTIVNIPVYLHFRANFTKSNWSPYMSVSIGGRVSKKTSQEIRNNNISIYYNQSGLLGDLTLGVDKRVTEKLSIHLGVGYKIESFLYAKCKDDNVYTKLIQGNKLLHGFSLHVGLSF